MNDAQRITRWELLLLTGIVILGIAFRLYQIDVIPPGLHNDEAAYALDAQAVLHGQHALFFERNSGREPLFIYLLALSFQIFGATPATIRLTATLIGSATILTTWWMVRELFRFAPEQQAMSPRWFALWTAAFLAVSYWHLSFSRLGFRAITLPLLTTITFALLWRAWREVRQRPAATPFATALLGGATLGLTLYTYTAGRMAFVLFLTVVGMALFLAPCFAMARRQLLKTATVFLGAALLVAAPLLIYFAMNPEYFAAHAAELSIFSPTYAENGPIGAFARSLFATLRMFISSSDLNLRHNPAQIPVFDPLLAIWLGLGVVVAVATWRKLTPAFTLLWFVLFLTPAVFSAERPPHSLRALGVLPIVYVLPLLAMAWVAGRTPIRFQLVMRWLPAPFWVLAAVVAVTSYFGAWTPIDRFRPFFYVDFANLASDLSAPQPEETRWLLPLDAPYGFNTIDFLLTHPERFATIVTADEALAIQALAARIAAPPSPRTVHVLRWPLDSELPKFAWEFADPRRLLDFLLRRNSRGPATLGETPSGISYAAYTLVDTPVFPLPGSERETAIDFGDAIELTAVNIGAGPNAAIDAAGVLTFTADSPLWAVLRWQAPASIPSTLKTSLVVQDGDGNWLTQVDELLPGARYPASTDWAAGERAATYHSIDLPAGLAPGRYTLTLRVYGEETGRTLPAQDATGVTPALTVATLDVLPPLQPGAAVSPQFSPTTPIQTGDLELLGYDLPVPTLAPGDRLPLTLYLRAPTTPTTTYTLDVTLRSDDGVAMAQQRVTPGGAQFPMHTWRAGEIVRIPVALPTDPALANGRYTLQLAFDAGGERQAHGDLATVEINGRPRVLTPPVMQPVTATFGDAVTLLGVDAPTEIAVAPGAVFTVTLIWQPLKTETRPLVRFVQLLNEAGQLVAQQDTVPCDGACPATGWLAGEYLLDTATLTLPPDLPPGAYTLIAGWYDPVSQQRLPSSDATGGFLPNDVVVAPIVVQVE